MKRLVEANPDDAEAWSVRGEFYLGLGARSVERPR